MYGNQSHSGECRALQIPSAISDLHGAANRVADLADTLSKRLEPILSPVLAADADGRPKSLGYSTPTAAAIQSGEFTLLGVEALLADLISRLEV